MAQSGGDLAAKLAKPSDGCAAAGEDRFSALPDDVLVFILQRLDTTPAAARTSVLSRRWRRVWALLPDIRFHPAPDGHRIRKVLDAPEAPALRNISVTTEGATYSSAAAWLPAAARRLSGALVYHNIDPEVDELEVWERGVVELPCFENATKIKLRLGTVFLGLALPSHGVFFRLTKLSLIRVRLAFDSPVDLGSTVSSPRCPCLRELTVHNSCGLGNLSIHSESLLEIDLMEVSGMRRLTILTPALQKLRVNRCFLYDDPSEPIANITAPRCV